MDSRTVLVILFNLLSIIILNGQDIVNPFEGDYYQVRIEGDFEENSSIVYYSKDTMFIAEDMESPFRPFNTYEIIEQGKMRFNQLPGGVCDTSEVAVYAYEFDAAELRFTIISDECGLRALNGHPFIYTRMLVTLPAISADSSVYISFSNDNGIEGLIDYESNEDFWWPPYEIYDIHGFSLQEGKISFPRGQLDFSRFLDGVYYLSVDRRWGWETIRMINFNPINEADGLTELEGIRIQNDSISDGVFQYVYSKENFGANYRVYTSDGKLVQMGEINVEGVIDLSADQNTVYYLIIYDWQGATTIKLMKESNLTTSVYQFSKSVDIKFYSNPSPSGMFNYTYSTTGQFGNYRVFDANGKSVKEGILSANGTIDLSQMPSSTYFIEVKDNDQIATFKLVK